jgi:hypothetical protein
MFSLESTSIYSTEFDTPQANRFATDSDASLGEQIFDITMAEIEAAVQLDCIADDVRRESVTLISIYRRILAVYLSVPTWAVCGGTGNAHYA